MKIRNLIWDEWNIEHILRNYGDYYPISARDMDDKEKRNYRKWIKR